MHAFLPVEERLLHVVYIAMIWTYLCVYVVAVRIALKFPYRGYTYKCTDVNGVGLFPMKVVGIKSELYCRQMSAG